MPVFVRKCKVYLYFTKIKKLTNIGIYLKMFQRGKQTKIHMKTPRNDHDASSKDYCESVCSGETTNRQISAT